MNTAFLAANLYFSFILLLISRLVIHLESYPNPKGSNYPVLFSSVCQITMN